MISRDEARKIALAKLAELKGRDFLIDNRETLSSGIGPTENGYYVSYQIVPFTNGPCMLSPEMPTHYVIIDVDGTTGEATVSHDTL